MSTNALGCCRNIAISPTMKWQVNLVAYQVPSETQPFRSESAFSAFAGEGARATHFEARFEEIFDFRQDLRRAF